MLPVKVVNKPVLPVMVVPDSCVVNTPDAKSAVVPVVVVPERCINLPLSDKTIVVRTLPLN